jgi:3-oxoadipate enol-lactonase
MPFAAVNNIELYYRAAGRGEPTGPALVLLHGLASSSEDWLLQEPDFGRQYRLLMVDLRGHGRSSQVSWRLTVDLMADDVARLLEALQEPPAHVLGLSLGGCVAQALALRHPERVRSLTLVNTFARFRPAGWRGLGRVLHRLWLLATAPMPAVAALVAGGLFPSSEQKPYYDQAVARLSQMSRRSYVATMSAVAAFDTRRQLHNVRCPTLVIAGDRDQTVPRGAILAMQRAIPAAKLRVIPNSGHATPYDQTAAFNQAVLDFLAAN